MIPHEAAARGRAFPTPRTWDYAARLSAFATAVGASKAVRRLLVAGCLGESVAHEFLAWEATQDLPDPEVVLAAGSAFDFSSLRADRVYVVLQGVLGAIARDNDPDRWAAAICALCGCGARVGIDPAVPVVRALVRDRHAAPGALVPSEISVFAPALALAGLLPGAA